MFDMNRRGFISLLSSAAAWPLAARAQQGKMPVVGFLSPRSPDDSPRLATAFRQGLAEAGYVAGQNVAIEYSWAENHYDRLPALAADLVRRPAAVIVASSTPAFLAAKAATSTIPIVFIGGAVDPVKSGLVTSLNRPGGNVTGVNTITFELLPKRLELLHEFIPNAIGIGLLMNPGNATAELQLREMQKAARSLGRKIVILNARSEGDFEAAFASFVQQQAGAVVIGSDPFFNSHSRLLAALSARYMLPAISEWREFAFAGGLMSYGTDFPDASRLGGIYTGRILKGEKPSDLPVQQATKVELIVNMKTAKALGLTVPLPLLGRADEVIE